MARTILRVLQDPRRRETCVHLGLERAGFFTWDRTAKETLQLFQDLVDGTT